MRIKVNKLYRRLVILILAILGLLLTSVFLIIGQARNRLAIQGIETLTNQASNQYYGIIQPVVKALSAFQEWGLNGVFDLNAPKKISAQIIPILRELPAISGFSIANENGDEFFIKPEANGWVYRYPTNSKFIYQSIFLDSASQVTKERMDTIAYYDPRERDWYKVSQADTNQTGIHWTNPYSFYSTGEWGISGAHSWIDTTGITIVASIDIPLKKLFASISQFTDNEESKVFIFNSKRQIFNVENPPDFFMDADKIFDRFYIESLRQWQNDTSFQTYTFRFNGNSYWVGMQPIDTQKGGGSIWLATLSREKGFYEVLGNKVFYIGLITFISILLAFTGSWWIVQKSRNEDDNSIYLDLNDFESSLNAIIAKGEGQQLEFKSTIRMNLHSGQTGKEIELAWLKGIVAFLNTKGGVLLIGVNDGGEITGLEADRFSNEDKCLLHIKNLISQHIGAEHFRFIEYGIKMVNGLQIVYFHISPSDMPAYLKDKNNEEVFYVRNGPASDKLSVSQVIEYLKHRKQLN